MLKKFFERQIKKYIDKAFLDKLLDSRFEEMRPIIPETTIWVKIRYPRGADLIVGEAKTLTQLVFSEPKEDRTDDEIIALMNSFESICRITLENPTFEELEQAIFGEDHAISRARSRIRDLREMLKKSIGIEADKIREELRFCELRVAFLLPQNFMAAVTYTALGADITDIRKVSRENLLEAYQKFKIFGGSPKQYIMGIFTDKQGDDIEKAALVIGEEWERSRKKVG